MIYKTAFDLKGTDEQQKIAREALDEIKFPFEKIKFPKGTATIGWARLNGQTLQTKENDLDIKLLPDEPPQISQSSVRNHEGDHPTKDTDTEPLTGEINGRKYTLGVFYPSTGNIYVDTGLVSYPHLAKTTISAEVAHGVDEFLPLTEQMRNDIKLLVHNGNIPIGHDCKWWEKYDYNIEYWDLIGESFMPLFTYAYSDLPFHGVESFSHIITPEMGKGVRNILGIQRIDDKNTINNKLAPSNVTVVANSYKPNSSLIVNWDRNASDNKAVELWIGGSLLITLPPYIMSYTISGLSAGTDYKIKLRNKWSEISYSDFSTEEIGTTSGGIKPVVTPVISEPISTPILEPIITIEPIVPPVVDDGKDFKYVIYGKSKTYHDPNHYKNKSGAKIIENLSGMVACKICVKSPLLRP